MNINDSLFKAARNGDLKLAKEIISTHGLSYSKHWVCGYKLLCSSIKNGHTETTKFLLTSGAKVNKDNKRKKQFEDTPLHFAVINGQQEIVEMLLDKGANINANNGYGGTPLENAVYRKNLNIIEILIKKGASVNDNKNGGLTTLHRAVQGGNLKVIELLLKYGANVNVTTNSHQRDGQTPLHLAADKGEDRIVELLLKNGAFVEAKSKAGLTPVYIATLHKQENVVKQLLDHGANVDSQDTFGKTILFLAVEIGSLKIVNDILKHGPDLNNKMNGSSLNKAIYGAKGKYKLILNKLWRYGFKCNPDHKLIQTAIEKGYISFVENFLKTQSNVKSFLTNVPKKSFTLLHTAAKKKKYPIAEMLIKYGANVNAMDKKDKTPIFYATKNGDLKTVKLLLKNKASVTNCSGLLMNAVQKESKEIVNLLLQHKVNVMEVDTSGRTALHFIALNEHDDLDSFVCMGSISKFIKVGPVHATAAKGQIAKILLAAGAEVNAESKDGKSTLHCACFKGYKNVVEVLFEYNAKMFADDKGTLPLHLCACSGNVDILKILLSKGADINAKTTNGWTAVHFATNKDRTEFLEYLLKHGADIDAKDNHGSTALHVAAKNDYLDFIDLLLNHGADVDCTDNSGRTALNIATAVGNDRIVRSLLDYGCSIKTQTKNSYMTFESAEVLGIGVFEDVFIDIDFDDDDDDIYDSDYDCFDCDSDYNAYYGSDEDYYDSDADYLDQDRNIFSGNHITEMLQRHVVMTKAANLPVKDENLVSNEDYIELSLFKSKCEQEIEQLKSEQICAFTNVTFYDILLKPIHNVAIYARNPKIIEVLKTDNYKIKFPIYSGLIKGKIIRSFIRKDLLEQGNVFFNLLLDSVSLGLPYNCTENICSYLSDKDLRILIHVSKPNM